MGAGSVLFPTQLPAGPRLTDHRTTTASIGDPVAIVFGTSTVAGTVIWLAPSVESKDGGKGGPQQTTYSYTQSIAIGLCEAVIDGDTAIGGLTRIWENGEIVYDIRPQLQTNTYTGIVAETDVEYQNRLTASAVYAETFTLYLGSEDQLPDPTIEANEGFGNVPAFRGLAYIVYPNRVLQTAQGWRHPNFQFEVYQAGTGSCTTTTLYSNDVLYPWLVDSADPTNPSNANSFHIIQTDPNSPTYENPGNSNQFSTLAAALAYADTSQNVTMNTPVLYRTWSVAGGAEDSNMRGGGAPGPNIVTYGSGDMSFVDVYYSFGSVTAFYNAADRPLPSGSPGDVFWYNGSSCIPLGSEISGDPAPSVPAPYLTLHVGGGTDSHYWYGARADTCIQVTRAPSAPPDPCAGLPAAPISGYCVQPDGTYVQSEEWVRADGYFLVLGTYISSNDTSTPCRYPQNPCVPLADAASYDEAFWTNAYNEAVANNLIAPGYTYVAGGGSSETSTYPKLQNYGWSLDKTVCTGAGSQASVGQIIAAVCARAGLDSVDVDDLNEVYIGGYTIANLTSGASIISPLRSVAFFDAIESADVLRFQSRGKDSVATLTTDDIGAYDGGKGDVPPSVQTTRTLDVDLARRIRLHYASTSRDYQDAEQDSPFRLTTNAVNDQDVSLPLSLGDTQALQSAEIIWADMWAGRTAHTVAVDQSWAALEPGDCIDIPVDSVLYRCRIVSYKVASGVLMTLSLVRDDGDNYFSTATAEPPKYTAPTLTFLAQTHAVFLDLPALQDADSDPGFYIAAARNPATGNAWPGAAIYQSLDGGETFNSLTTITKEATLGTLASAVPSSDWHSWDDATEIYVTVASSAFTFESQTDVAVLSGSNAAAMGADGRWEIIQFANAELISESTAGDTYQWKLTRLLRGRRGTEHNIGKSMAGDAFVIVSTGDLARIVQPTTAIGASRVYKAVTSQAPYSTAVTSTFTGHGEALVPFSPVDVKAVRQTSGDILISWIRRDRLGRTLMSGVDMPLSEATLAFQIDILEPHSPASPEIVLRTLSSTTTSATYTAAQQTVDAITDSVRVAVYQMSAVIGRGTPDVATFTFGTASDNASDNIVEHTLTVTFGGTFESADNVTISATFTPTTGAPSLYQWVLDGSGKSAVADYAADLATQAATSLTGKATVSHTGDVVTIITTDGALTASYLTSDPTTTVTVYRAATAIQAAVLQTSFYDLFDAALDYPGDSISPANDSAYNVVATANFQVLVGAYDPVVMTALQATIYPVPAGLEEGDYQTFNGEGLETTASYTTSGAGNTSYFNDISGLAAALTASSALRPYLQTASTGTASGMSRPAVVITMKAGYYLTDPAVPNGSQAHPSGYKQRLTQLTVGQPAYPSGAAKIVAVSFSDQFVPGGGTVLASTLAIGQIYRITINGTSYTHTANTSDMADPRGDGFGYYRDGIYEDLASQITTAGYTVQLSKYDRASPDSGTWIYSMTITGTAATDFTLTAQVDFDLTVSIATT